MIELSLENVSRRELGFMMALELGFLRPAWGAAPPAPTPIRDAVHTYLNSTLLAFTSVETRRTYSMCARSLGAFLVDRRDPTAGLHTVTQGDVLAWINSGGVAPATKRKRRGFAASFFGAAKDRGFVARSPLEGMRLRLPARDFPRHLGKGEFAMLKAGASKSRHGQRNLLMLALMRFAGLRVSEAVGLRWQDFESRTPMALLTVTGKGQKMRKVPVPEHLTEELLAYRNARNPHQADFMFPGRDPRRPISTGTVRAMVKRAGRDGGLGLHRRWRERLPHPHALRHTAAVSLLRAGASLATIREFLGHESLETTAIYTRMTPEVVAEDLGRLHGFAGLKVDDVR